MSWEDAPFGRLQALPKDGRPITSWPNRDEAFRNVAEGIKKVAQELNGKNSSGNTSVIHSVAAKSEKVRSGEEGEWIIVLSATVKQINKQKAEAILAHLQQISGDTTLTLVKVKSGSVVIILKGSKTGFERIKILWESSQLKEVSGFEIQDLRWEEKEQHFRYRPLKRSWELTEKAFDKLLQCLDTDREQAGIKYEKVYQKLVGFFKDMHPLSAYDLADETINRVISEIEIGEKWESGNIELIFFRMARGVSLEQVGFPADNLPISREITEEAERTEKMHECLEKCLKTLDQSDRDLILAYFPDDNKSRIVSRQKLAQEQGVSINALRVRIARLKTQLSTCVTHCLENGHQVSNKK